MFIFELQNKKLKQNYGTLTGRHSALKQRYEISALFTTGVAFHKYITKRNSFASWN